MPANQALQVFYGTVPLILVVVAAWLRESTLLKDILARLGRLEEAVNDIRAVQLPEIKQRLTVLETRAGTIFHGN
jgi:hypothetical protein